MKSIEEIMRKRINEHDQYGVGEPSIQSVGSDRLIVELAGITDLQKAKERDIKISITANANAVTVAEHVMFNLLNISKRNTSKNINIDSISHLEKVSYTTQHKGSKKFLALFCTNAVKISYNENDIENKIIFSTNDPEKMIKILENLGRNH